jgi:3-mercaptopyruvate sulfurtransferase SseA
MLESIVEGNFMALQERQPTTPAAALRAFIIDLRSPDSEMHEVYYYGHIPGAVNIPCAVLPREDGKLHTRRQKGTRLQQHRADRRTGGGYSQYYGI